MQNMQKFWTMQKNPCYVYIHVFVPTLTGSLYWVEWWVVPQASTLQAQMTSSRSECRWRGEEFSRGNLHGNEYLRICVLMLLLLLETRFPNTEGHHKNG